ncbi:VWFA-related Acidobacterial domain protein [Luteitalea pratensis]|uniref:VWFA-related Acidobacterial domain protein n=1 Tax=Luteitalea pratensis TaxID=1855912 RepID=A0A143PHS3_LUTPR|nr:VWA domain-containing protein [Luteitalea pratensis]AMY08071.1 VWFA-related Acidobacterial domain protein [Luteitalea pratensis]
MRSRPLLGIAALALMVLAPARFAMRAQAPAGQAPAQPATAPAPAPAPAPADGTQPATPGQPSFRVEANFVRVDVYPTAKGAPITDLTADDFEVLEDGKPQKVTQFERVALSTTTAREERRDPVSAADGLQQAADPRRRVFVLFLDTWHTTFAGAVYARKPLIDMLERLIGPEDLFAVMTPDMDPRHITFARRTETLDNALRHETQWGMRDNMVMIHPEEQALEQCFPEGMPSRKCLGPGNTTSSQPADAYRGIAKQLIRRRREKEVLDALEGLVRFLGTVKEERKALITVTSGYEMFEPKPELARPQECDDPPTLGGVGTGPDGRITNNPRGAQNSVPLSSAGCQALAMRYATLNNRQRFIELTQQANRYNVSFYPFDTRGLTAFDADLGARDDRIRGDQGEWYNKQSPNAPGSMMADRDKLNVRLDSLRLLADNTDGLAVINTNDLDGGAARIVRDLSSYYLLGYYSANEQLDGKWRTIKVRVKRPGVEVRARKGYRALRREDMLTASPSAAAAAAGGAGDAAAAAEGASIASALSSVSGIREGQPWRSRAAYFFHAGAGAAARTGRVWVTADLDPSTMRDAAMAQGGTLSITVTTGKGTAMAEAELPVAAGVRTATAELLTTAAPLEAGDLLVRLRFTPTAGSLPLTDTARLALPAADAAAAAPRLSRASPVTRQKFVPTADPRYRRNEKVRVEVPVAPGATSVKADLLDQAGKVMAAIPVTSALVAPDDAGIGWATADVALVPLGAGDYIVRVEVVHPDGTVRTLTGFKVVP